MDQFTSLSLATESDFKMQEPVSIAIIGDNKVGKSSICQRFFHKKAPAEHYKPTLAVDYYVKPIPNHSKVSRFAVFDVSITPQIYARSPCLGVVYDVANESSFHKAADLITFIDSYHPVKEKCVIIIANNCESANRQVLTQDGVNLAVKWKARYIETDALSGHNIESVFWTFARDFCIRMFDSTALKRRSRSLSPPTLAPERSTFLVNGGETKNEDDFRLAVVNTNLSGVDNTASESSWLLGAKKKKRGCCSCM